MTAQPEFHVTIDNIEELKEICTRIEKARDDTIKSNNKVLRKYKKLFVLLVIAAVFSTISMGISLYRLIDIFI